MTAAIRLENVTVRFGPHEVLRNVSFRVGRGERVVLIGPSGSGKSTLLGVLNGTVLPKSGRVWILGEDVQTLSPRARRRLYSRVGTVYQDLCLVDGLRVVHNVNAGNLARWSTRQALVSLLWPLDRNRVHAALQRVGIPEKIYEQTASLSGGQQQRVAIARILVQDPDLVLADEPISSLDPQRSKETMDLLCGLNHDFGKTIVTSCHSMLFARSHFERAIAIKAGEICFDAPVSSMSQEHLDSLYADSVLTGSDARSPQVGEVHS